MESWWWYPANLKLSPCALAGHRYAERTPDSVVVDSKPIVMHGERAPQYAALHAAVPACGPASAPLQTPTVYGSPTALHCHPPIESVHLSLPTAITLTGADNSSCSCHSSCASIVSVDIVLVGTHHGRLTAAVCVSSTPINSSVASQSVSMAAPVETTTAIVAAPVTKPGKHSSNSSSSSSRRGDGVKTTASNCNRSSSQRRDGSQGRHGRGTETALKHTSRHETERNERASRKRVGEDL